MNRRGRPNGIFNNCGTNFKGTVQELKIEARKVKDFQQAKVPHGFLTDLLQLKWVGCGKEE